jgi:DNA-binding transcriptional ArsR family regulator
MRWPSRGGADILNYLALQERSVTEIVDAMEMEQPSISKHLKVLKDVGLVDVRREGRQMLHKVNPMAIRPLHEWTSTFERLWKYQLLRIKERAEAKNEEKKYLRKHATRRELCVHPYYLWKRQRSTLHRSPAAPLSRG